MRILLFLMLLSGCAVPSSASLRPVRGPNGPAGYVECSDPDDCYELAGESCSNGYIVLEQGERVTGATAQRQAWSPYMTTSQVHVRTETHLLIQCKAAK